MADSDMSQENSKCAATIAPVMGVAGCVTATKSSQDCLAGQRSIARMESGQGVGFKV
jgi:hypothetical protein